MFRGGSDIISAAEKGHQFSIAKREREEPPFPRALLWESFWDLSTMRYPAPKGISSIPYQSIRWYVESELDLLDDEADAFVWIMRRADSYFVSKQNAKAAEATK